MAAIGSRDTSSQNALTLIQHGQRLLNLVALGRQQRPVGRLDQAGDGTLSREHKAIDYGVSGTGVPMLREAQV